MSSHDHPSAHPFAAWRQGTFELLCSRAAAVGSVLTRVRQQRPAIRVTPVSERWLREYTEETPKHAEDD